MRKIPDGYERNRPCDTGRKLGANLARHADKAEGRWRKELGCVPVRCPSCAFTEGTFPNGCLATTADATKCVMEGKPFLCHHGMNGNGPGSVCAGWLLLTGGKPVQCPWPFSDDSKGLAKLSDIPTREEIPA